MYRESTDGTWQKFPKHEVVKMTKYMRRLESVYGGVTKVTALPDALFLVDIKKEVSALREALRCEIKTIAIVDTNCDPTSVDYQIPANDDAVGSIQFIINYLVEAYLEGKSLGEKKGKEEKEKKEAAEKQGEPKKRVGEKLEKKEENVKTQVKKEKKEKTSEKEEKPKKRGRPKKTL